MEGGSCPLRRCIRRPALHLYFGGIGKKGRGETGKKNKE
jgi:hypothetical protein